MNTAETFETFYAKDWGSASRARSFRDQRRRALVETSGKSGVVRGKVEHPAHGEGFEVWYCRPADESSVRDLRVAPDFREQQTAPHLVLTEERWVE